MSGASEIREHLRNLVSGSGWRVLGSYLAASWVAYEVIEALASGLELPR